MNMGKLDRCQTRETKIHGESFYSKNHGATLAKFRNNCRTCRRKLLRWINPLGRSLNHNFDIIIMGQFMNKSRSYWNPPFITMQGLCSYPYSCCIFCIYGRHSCCHKKFPLLKFKTSKNVYLYSSFQRKVGNKITSLMDAESVTSIAKRSIPIPRPPVGGIPISSAWT